MKYIPPLEATDPEAPYVDAAPEAGIEGSPVGAKVFEQPQREIVNLTTALGLTPTEDDVDQLAEAHAAGKFLNIAGLPDHSGGALDAAEVPILTGGAQKRISISELFTGRSGLDQVARDQIALTNLRQILNTSVSTNALVQGRQFELSTDEWSSGSTSYQLVSASPNYYTTPPGVQAFSATGANQTWVVPAGVTSLTVKLWGGGGGAGGNANGNGGGAGFTTGTLAVTPGETLTIIAGSGGDNAQNVYGGGGAAGGGSGGGGGGRSAIRRGSTELATAGGGGGGANGGTNGGAGGGTTGNQGGSGGGGGTQSAGGSSSYNPGGAFQGGDGQAGQNTGGGGGGYYGGGGGWGDGAQATAGGGGGSGYIGGLTGASTTTGTGTTPAGAGDSDYAAGVGVGGTVPGGNGGNGRVVIRYTSTSDMTLVSPAVSVSGPPTHMDAYFLWKDDSGSAVLGTDLTVELSRDGGTTWAMATLTNLTPSAGFDGTYAAIKARADVSGQPSGTSLKARIKSLNSKAQRVAAPAIYAE